MPVFLQLLSMGSHRVGHDWSNVAAAAQQLYYTFVHKYYMFPYANVACGVDLVCLVLHVSLANSIGYTCVKLLINITELK